MLIIGAAEGGFMVGMATEFALLQNATRRFISTLRYIGLKLEKAFAATLARQLRLA